MALVAFETPSLIALPVAFAPSIVALVAFETALVTLFIVVFAASTVAFVALDGSFRGCIRNCFHCVICSHHCGVSCTGDCASNCIHCGICCIRGYIRKRISDFTDCALVAFTTEFVWLVLNAFDSFSAKMHSGYRLVCCSRISLLFPSASVNCSTFPTAIVALVALAISPIVAFVASIVALVALGII